MRQSIDPGPLTPAGKREIAGISKVSRPSYFVRVPSYFEALWYPHLYFDRTFYI